MRGIEWLKVALWVLALGVILAIFATLSQPETEVSAHVPATNTSAIKLEEKITDLQRAIQADQKYLQKHSMRITALEKPLPTIENVAPQVIPGVVHIKCPHKQASGFIVGPNLIATARHVTEGGTDFTITTHDGHTLHATRSFSMKEHDVGFIWIDDSRCVSEVQREMECSKVTHEVKLHVLELASIKQCQIGQTVFAIGSPYGKPNFNFLSTGVVSSLNPEWHKHYAIGDKYGWKIGWSTTAAAHPGNSGCPIFTLDGKVRGLVVGGLSPVCILAMPVDLFEDDLEEITRMFKLDEYKKEVEPTSSDYYNSKEDNEYYKAINAR